jgi:hypothetical protein
MWFAEIGELATNARLVGHYAVTYAGVRCQCQDHVYDIVPQRAPVEAREIEGAWGANDVRQRRRAEALDQLAGLIAGLGRGAGKRGQLLYNPADLSGEVRKIVCRYRPVIARASAGPE